MESKRGQVTIFIIIAILIVAAVLVFFLWVKPTYIDVATGKLNFENCMEDVVDEKVEILGMQAGFIEPELSYMYKDDKVGYLCYIDSYYETCVVQKPFVKKHFEEQLEKATKQGILDCYDGAASELRAQGYDVKTGTPDLDISLEPDKIVINLDVPTTVTREGSSSFKTFKSYINSPIYDILMIATSILQSETRYGDEDILTLMTFYPDLIIDKIRRGDGTKIYIIEDKESGTKFQFASRSLVWPEGYGV